MVETNTLIRIIKPLMMRDGKPTALTLKIQETPAGRQLTTALFNYYIDHKARSRPDSKSCKLDLNINIEDYRVCNMEATVNRIRKLGGF